MSRKTVLVSRRKYLVPRRELFVSRKTALVSRRQYLVPQRELFVSPRTLLISRRTYLVPRIEGSYLCLERQYWFPKGNIWFSKGIELLVSPKTVLVSRRKYFVTRRVWAAVTTKNTRIVIDSNKTELVHSLSTR